MSSIELGERRADPPLRVILIEDSADDAELIQRELRRLDRKAITCVVETADALRIVLDSREWDVVVSDWSLPQFSALRALQIVQASG